MCQHRSSHLCLSAIPYTYIPTITDVVLETDCVVVCITSLQSVVLGRFAQFVDDAPVEYGIHSVSSKMCDLLGLWLLEKHLNVLYEGTVVQ